MTAISELHESIPQLTVGLDARGSAVWLVVAKDIAIECANGSHATALLSFIKSHIYC